MSNAVVRWQIIAPDAEASAAFYSKLFGWTVNANNAMGYREIETGDGGIQGGVWPGPASEKPFVQLFVSVSDVDQSSAEAARLGASVVVPPSTLPDGDRMAVLVDPTGLSFGLFQGR